jgi:hypothetical protein
MNSKRIVFLLLAVIVAGATAFLARAWLQAERAAIAAQMGGARQAAAPAKPAVQVLVAKTCAGRPGLKARCRRPTSSKASGRSPISSAPSRARRSVSDNRSSRPTS